MQTFVISLILALSICVVPIMVPEDEQPPPLAPAITCGVHGLPPCPPINPNPFQ
jgi:hypothetical protein